MPLRAERISSIVNGMFSAYKLNGIFPSNGDTAELTKSAEDGAFPVPKTFMCATVSAFTAAARSFTVGYAVYRYDFVSFSAPVPLTTISSLSFSSERVAFALPAYVNSAAGEEMRTSFISPG